MDMVSYDYSSQMDSGYWSDLPETIVYEHFVNGVINSTETVSCATDSIGNRIDDGKFTYSWDHGRRLTGMTSVGKSLSFTYDAGGLRLSKQVQAGNATENFVYYYSGDKLVHMSHGNDSIYIFYDGSGTPVSFIYNGITYYYLKNIQGDITGIVDAIGNQIVSYSYDAWGNPTGVSGSAAATIGKFNPIRYRGYVYDEETGLYYVQSRYYDPDTARWISPEPNVDTGSFDVGSGFAAFNLFTYCANNPVVYKDSNGECVTIAIAGVTLGVKGLLALVGLITAASFATAYVADPNFRKAWDETCENLIDSLGRGLSNAISWSKAKVKAIEKSIGDSFAKTKTIKKYKKDTEVHHIVAKMAHNAEQARNVLRSVGLNVESNLNKVSIKTGLHRRLHTNMYYGWANSVVISAYDAAKGNKAKQKTNVENALSQIKKLLQGLSSISPY